MFRSHYIVSEFFPIVSQFAVLYLCPRLSLNILNLKSFKIYFMYSNTVYILNDSIIE